MLLETKAFTDLNPDVAHEKLIRITGISDLLLVPCFRPDARCCIIVSASVNFELETFVITMAHKLIFVVKTRDADPVS